MTDRRTPGPDFIIIGAMKCATSTLEAQLKRQYGIFMTEPKEPNYFGSDDHHARGPAWYGTLYAGAGAGDLRGEASTDYTKWPTYPAAPERMAHEFPDLKLVYMMKHPVERLISHYMHEWSMGTVSASIDRAIVQHPALRQYSLYARQLAPYFEKFGPSRILPVFATRFRSHPMETLQSVCQHIGYDSPPVWHDHVGQINVSTERLRTGRIGRYVIDSPVLAGLRRRLLPANVRDAIKARFRMNKAPSLRDDLLRALQDEFDNDLRQLPLDFGETLTCENFNRLTGTAPARWKP